MWRLPWWGGDCGPMMRPVVSRQGWSGVALTAVTFVVSFVFSYGPGVLRMTLSGALLISVVAAAAVWLSGIRPRTALVVVVVLAIGLPAFGATFEVMDLVVATVVFRVALASALPTWLLAAVSLGALTVSDAWQRVAFGTGFAEPSVLYPVLLTAMAVGLGARSRQVRQQHAELLALRDADRRRAVSDERRRIARDLHDTAAHHLSALVVHNRVARRVGTPAALDEAAEFTATTAARTLDSMRAVVQVLTTDSGAPLEPPVSLADLDDVIARMTTAGLHVERIVSDVEPLSPELQAAVVRITQEALANALRHRGPGRCWLVLDRDGDAVQLTIDDDGTGPGSRGSSGPHGPHGPHAPHGPHGPPSQRRDGHGLIGMRERAEACGGELVVGPSPRGGWRVRAVLPVPVLPTPVQPTVQPPVQPTVSVQPTGSARSS